MSHHVPTKRSRANQESVPWTVAREAFIWNVLASPDNHDFPPQLEPGDFALSQAEDTYIWTGLQWIQFDSSQHVAITLGAGSDAALTLSGQELTLADVQTPTEHTAIGDGAPHHAESHALDTHSSFAHVDLSDAPTDAHHTEAHVPESHTGTDITAAELEDLSDGGETSIHTHAAPDASVVTFTPTTDADWDGDADPGDVDEALDELAERTTDVEERGVFEPAYSSTSLWGTSGVWLDQTPFIGTVNGNPTSTSVVYNHTSGELSISHGQVLHNTTKGERVFIEAVNTGTNTLTVEANSPDDSDTWDNTDALTTASQTNTGRGGIFVDIDVTPYIIANSAVTGVSLLLTGVRRNADAHFVITHPYETFVGLRENVLQSLQDDLAQYTHWVQGVAVADSRYYFTMCFLNLAADNNNGTCRIQGQFTSLVA